MIEKKQHLQELIENKEWKSLKLELNDLEALHIATIIEALPKPDDIILFRLLSREQAKETFQHLSHDKQEDIIEGLAQRFNNISELLNDLDPDDRTAFLEELPGEITHRLLQLLSPEELKIAIQLLGYPEDSIGRLMTTEFVAVKPHYTIAHALEHIRKHGKNSETLNVIYVVDENWILIDEIRIKEIILANPDQLISDIMDYRFVALNVFDDQELAIKTFRDYDRVALPAIDSNGLLLGIVTFDDVMDVAEEESTEDFHKFGALRAAIVNPLKASVLHLYKKRIYWLSVLVFLNVFSGAAIANFENVIQSMVSLVFFLPLLINSGGNSGSQSATLMIRALAIGDVQLKDCAKLIGKDFIVSFLCGITMAACISLVTSMRFPDIVFVVAITMILIVIVGSSVGLLLPFVFTRLKIDPATASGPLVTSIVDFCGVVIYFTTASLYFGL
ncbi:MAG TPA: magnesium transporter [Bacteroidales bacterium]|nr:magnesium transporter [Bacteroidales bacterium]